jgi:tripartite-type tricarboxylate transporter receptor subunit TctC
MHTDIGRQAMDDFVVTDRRKLLIGASALGATLFTGSARAQSFPSKPIEWIMPYAAGGSTDLVCRLISTPLAERLGKPVVVINQPGASSITGTRRVATAKPDGHTMLGCAPAFTILASKPDLPYDVLKDLAPVTRVATAPFVLVVNSKSLPVTDMHGLIKTIKDAPDKYLYSHGGIGTSTHLAMEYFNSLTGLKTTGVPYPGGGGPGVQSVIAGHTHLTFASPSTSTQSIADGTLTVIGIANPKRWSFDPKIPTIAEQGVDGFAVDWWSALLTTGGTPNEVLQELNVAVKASLDNPAVVEKYKNLDYETGYTSVEEFREFLRLDVEKWRKVITTANIPWE